MKKISWLIILTLVISLVLPGLGPEGGLALAADTLRVAKFIVTQGDVKVLRAGGEKPFPAFKGMGLTQGDTVVTGKDGQATLEVAEDKEMKIAANTRLMISELVQSLQDNADQTSFYLKAGQVYTNVKKTLAPGAKYEIRTPTAVMGVRGTQFFVNLSNGLAQVVTLEGQVTITISQQVTGDDGTVTTQNVEIQVQPNQVFVQSGSETGPTQYNLETLTSNDNLSLFVLETLQEINEQQPGLIDAQLLEDLAEQIEKARQEEEQELQEYEQEQQDEDNQDDGSGDDTGSITIASIDDLSLVYGEETALEISVNPADARLSVSVGNEDIAEALLEGTTLVITAGERLGVTNITITASKRGYQEETKFFRVMVSAGNNEEEITIESIDDLSLAVGDEDTVEICTDPEDAELSVEVENESIAEATLDGGTIYISALSAGSTTITVTAEKEGYSPGEESFTVTVSQGAGTEPDGPNRVNPDLAYDPVNNRYLMVYEKELAEANPKIYGRFISAGGVQGAEFAISEGTHYCTEPDVVYNSFSEDFLVAWADMRSDEKWQIYAQILDYEGEPYGDTDNFAVCPVSEYSQDQPAVAVNTSTGDYLIAWREGAAGDLQSEIYGQLLNQEGVQSGEKQTLVSMDWSQYDPVLAYSASGNKYLLAFVDSNDVLGLMIESDGTSAAEPFTISTVTTRSQFKPDVAADDDNERFLVVWQDNRDPSWESDIYGRFISDAGSLGTEIVVIDDDVEDEDDHYSQTSPSIAISSVEGSVIYLVAWEDHQVADQTHIYAQLVTAEGTKEGSAFKINTTGENLEKVKVVYNSCDNNYLVAYEDQDESPACIDYIVVDGPDISPTTPPQLEDIIIHNYATGADNVRVFDHIGGGLYKAYNASEDGDLIGQEYGIDDDYVYINIDDGFESSLSNVYITATDIDMEKPESSRTAVEIPLPKLQENIDFAVDISENGLGRISFDVSETQAAALSASLGEENLVIRAFVGKEENSTVETLPALDDSNVDIIVIEPGHPEGIGRKPGQYPYAVAVYDEDDNVLAIYLSGSETATTAFDSIEPDEVLISDEFTESFTLTLKDEESTEFDAGIDTGDFTLEGAFDPSVSVIALEYCGSKEIMILISGSQTATGEGIIRISQEALNEGEDNSEADIYATVQIMEAY